MWPILILVIERGNWVGDMAVLSLIDWDIYGTLTGAVEARYEISLFIGYHIIGRRKPETVVAMAVRHQSFAIYIDCISVHVQLCNVVHFASTSLRYSPKNKTLLKPWDSSSSFSLEAEKSGTKSLRTSACVLRL